MTFNIYNILIIAGIIQGFIFTGVVLFNKKYKARSTIFLATLITVYSLGNLMYILPDIGLLSLLDMYNYWFYPFASIIPVIIYFYVVLFLNPLKRIKLIEKLLFFPFILFLIVILIFRVRYILGFEEVSINSLYVRTIHINEIFSVLFSIILLLILIRKIIKDQKLKRKFNLNRVHTDLKWLLITISIIFLFSLNWAYLTYKNIFTESSGEVSFYSLWIGIAATIYWLGHIGIYKYGIIAERKKIRKFLHTNTSNIKNTNSIDSSTGYTTSKHTRDYIKTLENLLINKKLFLDSSLTLETVAEQIQLSPSYLSRIIHNEMNTSFPDYLNSYRIEEAKSYLKNPEFSKYTIVSIGLEAGFNSKSSFYSVFKKTTGETPAAFKKGIRS